MTLNPGDPVKETCDQLGNFPAGIITNPEALAFEPPTPPANGMFLADKVEDYKGMFKSEYKEGNTTYNVEVCNAKFATRGTPLICSLNKTKKDSGGGGGGKPYHIYFERGAGNYFVFTTGPAALTGDGWTFNMKQSPPRIGSEAYAESFEILYNLYDGPFITSQEYNSGVLGSYYINNNFGCTVKLVATITGTKLNLKIDCNTTLTITNDYSTEIVTKSFSGIGYSLSVLITFSESKLWLSKGIPGTISKQMSFNCSVATEFERWLNG